MPKRKTGKHANFKPNIKVSNPLVDVTRGDRDNVFTPQTTMVSLIRNESQGIFAYSFLFNFPKFLLRKRGIM